MISTTLKNFIQTSDALSRFFGALAGWLCFILVLLTTEQVLARYIFNSSSVAMQELEWHLFGFVFLLAAANTLRTDGQVRVDLLYEKLSKRAKSVVDITGILFLLLPVCLVIIYYGFNYALAASSFTNPHPPDYYTAALFNADGITYQLLSPVESLIRKVFLIGEVSPDPGGLEARWIIKAAVPFGFVLMLLQGLALLIRKIAFLFSYDLQLKE